MTFPAMRTLLLVALTVSACNSATPPREPARQADDTAATAAPQDPSASTERIVSAPTGPPAWQVEVEELVRPYFPFLDGEREDESVSVGTTRDGWLMNGMELPAPGATWQMLPVQYARGLRFGTEELIGALIDSSAAVAEEFPGSILYLGNVGNAFGGDIPWSVSHNNGRDVDVAFYSTNALGWQTRPDDLLHFDEDLLSQEHHGLYRFDVPRNAALIEALITHPDIQLQFMFMARHLQRPVMAEIRKRGRISDELVDRLTQVLHEPRGALPHDDHLHLRIYCSKEDVCGGCVNDGRVRPWIDDFEDDRRACVEEYLTVVATDARPMERADALRRLTLIDGPAHLEVVRAAVTDDAAEVRRAAVELVGQHGSADDVASLIALDEGEVDDQVHCAVADALGALGTAAAAEHLTAVFARPDVDCLDLFGKPRAPLSLLVARQVGRLESKTPVEPLINVLADGRPEVRAAAADALRLLTNHAVDFDWSSAGTDNEALANAIAAWQQWYAEHADDSRDVWLVAGFNEAGFPVETLSVKSIEPLLDAIQGPPHVSYNAQRVLMRISNTEPPSLSWPVSDAAWHWTRYFKQNQRRFKIDLSHRPER